MTTGKPINGTKGWIALFVAALLSGTGGSFVGPQVWPNLYRPDPATGTELRRLKSELLSRVIAAESTIEALETQVATIIKLVEEMIKHGPEEVNNKLDALLKQTQEHHLEQMRKLEQMHRGQVEHFQNERSPPQYWIR